MKQIVSKILSVKLQIINQIVEINNANKHKHEKSAINTNAKFTLRRNTLYLMC